MKKSVLDLSGLQEIVPFFKTKVGAYLGKWLIKWLNIDTVNEIHAKHCHLRGSAFTSALLSDPLMDIRYKVHNPEVLNSLPEGAFITVSNHPFGSIDGIMLIDIFASRRPDFAVMVNGVLTKIGAMEDNFISVKPDSKNRGANVANVNGVRTSLERLKSGHPMGFFPSGSISFYDKKAKRIQDLEWTLSVIKLIRKGQVPVYPVYFDGLNTSFFYWLGRFSWKIRTLRIPTEAFNKKGKVMNVYVGDPISVEEQNQHVSDQEFASFLFSRTYSLKSELETNSSPFK